VLELFTDPDLAFLLLTAGVLAVVWDVANGSVGLGAVIGGLALLAAVPALTTNPVSLAGLLLVLLAAALFVAEGLLPGVGAFAAGGALALLAGGLLLFDRSTGVAVTAGLAIAVAAVAGAAALAIGAIAAQLRLAPPAVGAAGTVVGAVGVVKEAQGHTGQVLVEGARWQARGTAPLRPGMQVRVVSLDGLHVTVEPVEAPTQP
jgi:membrane-bound serine protease (ClpP class)